MQHWHLGQKHAQYANFNKLACDCTPDMLRLEQRAHEMGGLPWLVALLHSSRQGAIAHLLLIALHDLRHRSCSEGW